MTTIDPAVEAYLAKVPEPQRRALARLRATIRAVAPDADETISYGMPAFKQNGPLVGFAAFRNHCSFFPMSGTLVTEFTDELGGYKISKGAVQFTPDRPLPDDLVRRMVERRVGENAERAAEKRAGRRK